MKHFLGIEVERCNKGIVITQHKYTPDLLEERGMLGAKQLALQSNKIMVYTLKVRNYFMIRDCNRISGMVNSFDHHKA